MDIVNIVIIRNIFRIPSDIVRYICKYIKYNKLNNDNIGRVIDLWIEDNSRCLFLFGHISFWNVRKIKKMNRLFFEKKYFNDDISMWDVSNVVDMSLMFCGASSFNSDISGWNVSSVEDMREMFASAYSAYEFVIGNIEMFMINIKIPKYSYSPLVYSFNQDISKWDVGNVTDMYGMFYGASLFNQDISKWNVGNVRNMSIMFYKASSFNQDISTWDIRNVEDMENMFRGATTFNQNLNKWIICPLTVNTRGMFYDASSFDKQNISKWNKIDKKAAFYN